CCHDRLGRSACHFRCHCAHGKSRCHGVGACNGFSLIGLLAFACCIDGLAILAITAVTVASTAAATTTALFFHLFAIFRFRCDCSFVCGIGRHRLLCYDWQGGGHGCCYRSGRQQFLFLIGHCCAVGGGFLAFFTSLLLGTFTALTTLTTLVLPGFARRAGGFRLGCCRRDFLGFCLGCGGIAFVGTVASAAAATAIAFALATFSPLTAFALLGLGCCSRGCSGRGCRCGHQAAQPAEEFRDQVVAGTRGEHRLLGHYRFAFHDGSLFRRNALDHCFLARLDFVLLAGTVADVGFRFFRQAVAGLHVFLARIVLLDAFQLVMRGFQVLVRNHDDGDAVARLDLQDFTAFLVQQESSNVDRRLHVDGRGIFLHCFFLDDAQDLQCGRFGIADMAGAVAARASHVTAFGQRRAQALARQFHQAEA